MLPDLPFVITTEKYPEMLLDQPKWVDYKEDAVALIRKLHSLGIFHGNISEENFVINPNTKEIRLKNFRLSYWIDEITETQCKSTYTDCTSETSVAELLELEVKEIQWLCDQKK